MGKLANTGLNLGIRAILPDFIENQVIEIKDCIIKEGFGEGVKKLVNTAMDLGKSALGIVTGNFENISQVQSAVKNGGIIDGISNVIDFTLNKITKSNLLPDTITKTIRQGKNVILNNIANNIENKFNEQLESVERLQKYEDNWKDFFKQKDFDKMQEQIYKINAELKTLMPMENTLKEARNIQNLHTLIKNNGKNFNLSKEEIELTKMLS